MSEVDALILGCGYVGVHLARTLVGEGLKVAATSPRSENLGTIEATGARPIRADVLEPATLRPLPGLAAGVVFDLIRPQPLAADRYTTWGTRNIANLFSGVPLKALVHLSSTSVYEGRTAEWMDEDTEVDPATAFGQAQAEAERIYLDCYRENGLPVRICRAATIYGPHRTLRERLEGGAYTRVDDDEQWVSRIHVHDLVAALVAAWKRGRAGETYLLCDDEPATEREYAEITADLLGLPLPPPLPREDIRQELGAAGFERRAVVGRCSNRRMHEALGVELRYPSVREGVPASLREEGVI